MRIGGEAITVLLAGRTADCSKRLLADRASFGNACAGTGMQTAPRCEIHSRALLYSGRLRGR